MIELDLFNPKLAFLGLVGSRFPVLTCGLCTCFRAGFVFARVSANGDEELHPANAIPGWLPDDASAWGPSPWSGVAVRLSPRRAIHAVDWCTARELSQIGGMPSWVQDTAYPTCPDCRRTMRFIAQLDQAQFKGREGVYYAFMCADCRTTATTYQQT